MTKTVPDAHLLEQIADAKERQAKGEGEPGDCDLAHYDDKEPERRVAQRRVSTHVYDLWLNRRHVRIDRRQNAAEVSAPNDMMTAPYTASGKLALSAAPSTLPPDYWQRKFEKGSDALDAECASEASTLPLSAEQIESIRDYHVGRKSKSPHRGTWPYGDKVHDCCDQALRAIELEQRIANLNQAVSELNTRYANECSENEELSRMLDGANTSWFALQEQLAERGREIARLEQLVYVPGVFKCAKCGLSLVSTTLSVAHNLAKANNEPQQCPNGCGPLWRKTERDAGNELCDRLEKAEAELAELRREKS